MTIPPSTPPDPPTIPPSPTATQARGLYDAVYDAPSTPIESKTAPDSDPELRDFIARWRRFFKTYNGTLVVISAVFVLYRLNVYVHHVGFNLQALFFVVGMIGAALVGVIPVNICFLLGVGLIRIGLVGWKILFGEFDASNRYFVLSQWACFLSGLGLAGILAWVTLVTAADLFLNFRSPFI